MENFYRNFRIVASVPLIAQGLYYSSQGGYMNIFNPIMGGIVFCAIWFDRKKAKK